MPLAVSGAAISLLAATAVLMGLAGPAQASRRVFLWFADGGIPPRSVTEICATGRPPAFRCALGPAVADCRQAIQVFLDRWYADADVVFTYAPPADGSFDTVVLSNDGAWCNEDARTVSRSPLPMCTTVERGAIAIFRCDDAKACATLIAKEQAHLLGLQHTASPTDVMNELGGTEHDGFEDRFNGATSARCGALQNSRRLLIERAGAWPGGAKPDPGAPPAPVFPETTDASADAAGTDAAVPETDSGAPEDTQDGGGEGTVDTAAGADAAGARGDSGGCGCSYARAAPANATFPLIAAAVAAILICRRRRAPGISRSADQPISRLSTSIERIHRSP